MRSKQSSALPALRRLAALIARNLAVAFVLLLVLEGATRAVGLRFPSLGRPGSDRALWVYDETRGWFHRPSARGQTFRGGPDRGTVHINRLGLRGPEISLRKGEGVRRLLVVGDSFAFGVGVDEPHLLSTRLATLLGKSAADPWEVVNLSVSGYSTDQELILFEELGSRLSPDVVLLVACDNDFRGNTLGFIYQQYYKPFFVMPPGGELRRRHLPVPRLSASEQARLWMARRSNVWNAIRSRRPTHPLAALVVSRFQVRPPLDSGEDAVSLTAALVRAMRARAEAVGARFGLVNTGHRGENTTLFHDLRPQLRRDGIRFLGLEEELQWAREADPEADWDFGRDTHWNVDAHRRAAEVIHGFLLGSGLLASG